MLNVRIGDLPEVQSLNSADILPTSDVGANPGSPTTYKVTVKNLANSLPQVSSSISASYALNGGVTSIIAGTGISVNSSIGNVTVSSTSATSSFPITLISGSNLVSAYSRSLNTGLNFEYSNDSVILGVESAIIPYATLDYSVVIGTRAASQSKDSANDYGVVLGTEAAASSSAFRISNIIGTRAGYESLYAVDCIYIGSEAGRRAQASLGIAIGSASAYQYSGTLPILIGIGAGREIQSPATSQYYSQTIIGIGYEALGYVISTVDTVGLGVQAGAFSRETYFSNYLGERAGAYVSRSTYDNFMGHSAGLGVTKSLHNTFIGSSASLYATAVSYSNFIGYQAGYSSSGAQYSNFIGYQAGYRAPGAGVLSTNNTIIGTNITLPNGYGNYMNFGGALFISGTYSVISPYPFSGSEGNSRIGINIVNPLYNLDVSGSANFTNNVIITGSLTISGSQLPELNTIGDAIVTGSFTVSGSRGAGVFSQGATLVDYTIPISNSGSYMVWRAPFSCSVVSLQGFYIGGSSPQINAARSGSSGYGRITGSNVLLNQSSTWIQATGSGLQNRDFNAGDSLQVIMSGSSNFQLSVQVDFVRKL